MNSDPTTLPLFLAIVRASKPGEYPNYVEHFVNDTDRAIAELWHQTSGWLGDFDGFTVAEPQPRQDLGPVGPHASVEIGFDGIDAFDFDVAWTFEVVFADGERFEVVYGVGKEPYEGPGGSDPLPVVGGVGKLVRASRVSRKEVP